MKRTVRNAAALVAVAVVVSAVSVGAAIKKEEKSKFKMGGAMGKVMGMFMGRQMREGVVTTVAIKGDRRLSRSGDTGQLVDLAAEKVYDIDFKKKSYTVLTFDEVRQRMKEQQEKLKKQQAEMQAEREKNADKVPEYDIEVNNKLTGEAKDVNGFPTKQMITTITMKEKGKTVEQGGAMVMTIDQWLTPRIAGAQEEVDFERRYAEKIGMLDLAQEMAMATAMYPGMLDMMKRAKVEGDKLDGTPILSVTAFESVLSPEQQKQQERAESDSGGGGGGLTGMFARKMMRKKKDEPAEGGDAAAKGKASIMTLTHEVLRVSPDVADADLAVPADFKQKD